MAKPRALGPGATLGMLGGGQLGRMFGLAARRCGYQLVTYGDPADSPCGQISDASFPQSFTDWDALGDFAARVSVVTWEQENIPVSTVEFLRERVPVYPSLELLRASQHRLLEKTALRSLGIPTADFLRITSVGELQAGLATFGGAGILKTVTLGYDGTGQAKLSAGDDLAAVWQRFGVSEAILERIVDFDFELSIVCSRFADGSCHFFEPSLNEHVNHILDVSTAPSLRITAQQAAAAREMARTILQHFDVYGVLCVELFVDRAGHLLVNVFAARRHTRGHR
ncbi:MAG: ATP-grasp domain-containing protein, partial [Planctomyces sp.]